MTTVYKARRLLAGLAVVAVLAPAIVAFIAVQIGVHTPSGHLHHRHVHFAPDASGSPETAHAAHNHESAPYSSSQDKQSGEIPGFGLGLFALAPYAILIAAVFVFAGNLTLRSRSSYRLTLPLPHPPPRAQPISNT
ncbi:MAG: hypothetical protein OXG46_13400 [Chloroflexi bacterium]|nr:hypothetical protein [Chloroflexota bacterium]MCY3937103.1 hypothetical protein [Chloroflexota bacterium]